jgi:hypothetical protein
MNLRIGILLILLDYTALLNATQYVVDDLAPRGAADAQLNTGDLVVLTLLVDAPTLTEMLIADIGPICSPDNISNVSDILVLQRALSGDIVLEPIVVLSCFPILNSIISPGTQNSFQITGIEQTLVNKDIYINGVF